MRDEVAKAIGATLNSVVIGRENVVLKTDLGELRLFADGDCCSYSWFESVESDAEGGQITEIDLYGGFGSDPVDVTAEETQHRDDQVLAYFPLVKTTKGRVVMEMRNASNGYYGGSIVPTWTPAGE